VGCKSSGGHAPHVLTLVTLMCLFWSEFQQNGPGAYLGGLAPAPPPLEVKKIVLIYNVKKFMLNFVEHF